MKKLEEKPFALLGVNTNNSEAKKLKEVMDREKLNWRSFVTQETITDEWNNPGTPMYYVIDHRGVIRSKWLGDAGEKVIDEAIEKLVNEAERDARKSPK